jgi:ssDNA-binding Zn-finger/Zn-ribbon topoisomerase 1
MSYEDYLKKHICPECHAGILEPHPEETKNFAGYVKCPICSFTKLIHERKRKSDIIKKRKRS